MKKILLLLCALFSALSCTQALADTDYLLCEYMFKRVDPGDMRFGLAVEGSHMHFTYMSTVDIRDEKYGFVYQKSSIGSADAENVIRTADYITWFDILPDPAYFTEANNIAAKILRMSDDAYLYKTLKDFAKRGGNNFIAVIRRVNRNDLSYEDAFIYHARSMLIEKSQCAISNRQKMMAEINRDVKLQEKANEDNYQRLYELAKKKKL